MEIVLVWIVFAIICGVVANNKGRSVGGWVVAGLIFGIFALVVLALLKPTRQPFNSGGSMPNSGPFGNPGGGTVGRYGAPDERQ